LENSSRVLRNHARIGDNNEKYAIYFSLSQRFAHIRIDVFARGRQDCKSVLCQYSSLPSLTDNT